MKATTTPTIRNMGRLLSCVKRSISIPPDFITLKRWCKYTSFWGRCPAANASHSTTEVSSVGSKVLPWLSSTRRSSEKPAGRLVGA